MRLSRRALLSAVPAAPLLAAALNSPAHAAPRGADHERILANTVALLAGTPESNARPEAAAKLAAIDTTARDRLAALDAAGPGELFRGVPLGENEAHLTTSFQYLAEIALATRVPGGPASDLPGNAAVRGRVIDALAWLHATHYGDQSTGYYGNWHAWEIGISTHLSRALVLLADELAAQRPDLAPALVATMDAYLRNGEDGDVDLDSRFHTGANLADITTNRVLQGAVLDDAARVTKAVADHLTVYATVDPYHLRHGVTDGFYADGSFIQHASVAYTGSYGTSLLTRVVQTIKILQGTGHGPEDGLEALVATVTGWLADGFAPLIHEGWMMELVRGRAVSRTTTGYAAVASVVEAVVDLSAHATGAEADALKGYVKHLRETSRAPLDPAAFLSPVSVGRYADILADASIPAADLNPPARHAAFNAMDKTVHRRPGYAFALARSSSRISKYEYMNGENLRPWFQGEGAHHLYLSGQDQTLGHGTAFYATVSPTRLAGVTAPVEERRTVPELYGGFWYDNPGAGFTSSSEAQNTYVYFPRGTHPFSGGARLGAYGVAGLVQSDDAAYAAAQQGLLPSDLRVHRNARATKSWFMLDDEIVVMAAGVGDPAGRAVTTTVDARVSEPADEIVLSGRLANGERWPGTGERAAPLAWLRWADATRATAVGYVFLDGERRPAVTLDTVTRSLRVLRASNPDTPVTRRVFSVTFEQPAGDRPRAMAWALVPGASERRLSAYAEGPLAVLSNTTRLQAVEHTGLRLLAANAFAHGTHRAGRLSVEGPASVLLREAADGTVSLALADPTTERDRVAVVLRGRRLRPGEVDAGVTVRDVPGGTRVEAATGRAYGRSFAALLR
ncbi:polysaccharide lyase family 8 super-sandwich domain-containing protein [Streptomyces sp. PT12]|uniref:polysaccharide lyase family 8 super-sandwich domain-containing protein n=1 Tax=Streptomyces sp. PT12 TaxID=1510197 RepID=UPI000DE1F92B|nr:polysaccharide lyase family 8 super-sandwich domain-containing protein [Streptomyces sp. PT12]RBM14405.1 silent information regulator protein Sir2 [Streptomyces sp. PT12]